MYVCMYVVMIPVSQVSFLSLSIPQNSKKLHTAIITMGTETGPPFFFQDPRAPSIFHRLSRKLSWVQGTLWRQAFSLAFYT